MIGTRPVRLSQGCERIFLLVGLAFLGVYAGCTAYSGLYQAYASQGFDRSLNDEKGSLVETPGGPFSFLWRLLPVEGWSLLDRGSVPPPGSTIGRLQIPSIGLSVMVLEGTDELTLTRGVGRIAGTAAFGSHDNVGIAGHRDGYFRGLGGISKNDRILVRTRDGHYEYRVEEVQIVDPEDTHVLAHSPQPILTLVTCYPFQYIGSAPRRFVVRASLSSGKRRDDQVLTAGGL